jgi:uncharacterized protein YbjT (DUF2867 family)
MTAKILSLTGATGFVGGETLRQALAAGWQVRALTRRPQAAQDGVSWIAGDLHSHAALAELVRGASAVLHIAGVVNAPDKAGFISGNVTASENMLKAAVAEGIIRFIHVSSLSAREPTLSQYGWSKAEGENRITASDRNWTVVRPPAVFGPRDTEMLDLFRMAKNGLQMAPKGRISAIYVAELARLLVTLADDHSGMSTRAIYEPDDGRDGGWSHKQFGEAIGKALGRDRMITLPVPEQLLYITARLDKFFRGSKAKLTPDRAAYIAHPDWVVTASRRPPHALWSQRLSTPDALAETVAWYRREGWL